MSNNEIHLRAHHLLCSVLFEGKGYSRTFTENMTAIVEKLKEPDCVIMLQKEKDLICTDCPNLQEDESCGLDKGIHNLDRSVLEFFELSSEVSLSAREVFQKIEADMTQEFFDKCCDDCRWKKMGICNYPKYMKNIKEFC